MFLFFNKIFKTIIAYKDYIMNFYNTYKKEGIMGCIKNLNEAKADVNK